MKPITYPIQTTQQVVDDNLPEARLMHEFLTAQIEHDIDTAPAPKPVTVDGWMRQHQRAQTTRMLRQIATELAIAEAMFPPPIGERVATRAAERREAYAAAHRWFKRYRGAHRVGCWSVDALTEAVIAQKSADRAAHRASLRRPPVDPRIPIWIGDREIHVQFYGAVPTDPDHPAGTATLTITPDDSVLMTLPTIAGPADVDTGPMVPPLTDTSRWTATGSVGKFAGYRQVSDEEARNADPTWTPVPEPQWPLSAKYRDDNAVVAHYRRWLPPDDHIGRHRAEEVPPC